MSIFKIKLLPVVKEKDWKVSYVQSSQKPKVCHVCKKNLPIGSSGTTFTKRTKVGAETKFRIYHTCGHRDNICTMRVALDLNVRLP